MSKKRKEIPGSRPERALEDQKGEGDSNGASGGRAAPGGSASEVKEPNAAYARDEGGRGWIVELESPRMPIATGPGPVDHVRMLGSTPAGVRILEVLASVFPTEDAMLSWLHHPHEDLGGRTPLEVVAMGYPGAVEGMLEAALIGLPS